MGGLPAPLPRPAANHGTGEGGEGQGEGEGKGEVEGKGQGEGRGQKEERKRKIPATTLARASSHRQLVTLDYLVAMLLGRASPSTPLALPTCRWGSAPTSASTWTRQALGTAWCTTSRTTSSLGW